MKTRIVARNWLELIFVCVICALLFVVRELVNAPFGWEDELGFHFGSRWGTIDIASISFANRQGFW
jgi:hypothetical protein